MGFLVGFSVNGQWSGWTTKVYTPCTKSCGRGQRTWTQQRFCNSPSPGFGGKYCVGSNVTSDTEVCSTNPCPGNLTLFHTPIGNIRQILFNSLSY